LNGFVFMDSSIIPRHRTTLQAPVAQCQTSRASTPPDLRVAAALAMDRRTFYTITGPRSTTENGLPKSSARGRSVAFGPDDHMIFGSANFSSI
jgi:hypothetical protein